MSVSGKHSFKTLSHQNLGLSVYNCGFQQYEPLHSWGPAVKDHNIIHIISSGKGSFTCKDKKYFLSAGDGFICMANQLISYQADKDDPWKVFWVGFSGVDAQRLINALNLSADNPCFHSDNFTSLINYISKIYDSNGNKFENEVEMSSYLYRFFSQLIKESQNDSSFEHISTDYVSAAVKFIEYNYSSSVSITDIAESAGISRSHLYRLFLQDLNMTPNQYLIQYRISNACKLLSQGSVNISEAAYSSGFSDPLYFSRVFKKIKGITPSEYAKQKNKKDRI